jgi:hypothetical protein
VRPEHWAHNHTALFEPTALIRENLDTLQSYCPAQTVTMISLVLVCFQLWPICGLLVRFTGSRSRGSGLNSRRYQVFREVGSLEWGPLSLVRINEELLGTNASGSGLGNRHWQP